MWGRAAHRYERVFGKDSTQAGVYDVVMQAAVRHVLDGYNSTVFAYGQTGTGKTYTMSGAKWTSDTQTPRQDDPTGDGLIPRAFQQLFEELGGSEVADAAAPAGAEATGKKQCATGPGRSGWAEGYARPACRAVGHAASVTLKAFSENDLSAFFDA